MKSQNLKFHSLREWICRIYYTIDGELYCFQESFEGYFEFYACGKDGEPTHKVRLTDKQIMGVEKPYRLTKLTSNFWKHIHSQREQVYLRTGIAA